MKKSFMVLFCLIFLGLIVFTAGCQKNRHFQTVFPLEADEVTELLEQVGLPGEISKEETNSGQAGRISYVIRDPAQTYADSGNRKMVANIVSLSRKEGRALSTVFVQNAEDDSIVWQNWEQQIKLAALLYGGFEDEQILYKACRDAQQPDNANSFRLEQDLTEEYCCVQYSSLRNKIYDESGFEHVSFSLTLRVDIYESRKLYEQIKTDMS